MRTLLPFLALLLTAGACQNQKLPSAAAKPCVDSTKINQEAMCTMQYDPVCGCDGKTYGNACTATNAGLTSFTPGACPDSK